jgi:FAD/FMN-containing dehydrogenase
VIRFGTTRAQVVGIEAVLANGEIVGSLSGLAKETTGLHLPSVLSGSEGTLAIITAVRLKLVPWYQHTATAMVALDSLTAAIELLPALRRDLAMLDSVELLMPSAMSLVCEHLGRTCAVRGDAGAYLLIECAAHSNPVDELLQTLTGLVPDNATAVATDTATRASLVAFRDNVTTAINHVGVPLKLDVALPLGALAATTSEIDTIIGQLAPQSRLINFGHLAEGNLHLNILNSGDAAVEITDRVLQLVIERGGAISAEHGIGVAKTRWLAAQRGDAEVHALRAVKHALDPGQLLNPGVLLSSS